MENPDVQEAAFIDNAAKIQTEILTKLVASEVEGAVVPAPSPAAAAAAAEAVKEVVPTPEADPFRDKLLARLADMEKQLAEARKPVEAAKPAPAGIDPQELMLDLPGVLKRAGIPAEYAARALLGTVAPDSMSPDQRTIAATQTEFARVRQALDQLQRDNQALRGELRRGEYRAQAQEFTGTITADLYPAVAAAVKTDSSYVRARILEIAQADARERAQRDPNSPPITPAEAAKRLETELQSTARLLGVTLPSPGTTAQPAAIAPAAPKPVVPAATALTGAPAPSSARIPTWEEQAEQIRAELVRKLDSAGPN